ncbi:hypothetical protein KSW81_005703 [Nannochloris sp. 'desiccata']|nr:hypothetical protein KSW81_005703 [Chlorella desiccata (nom. nud.)]
MFFCYFLADLVGVAAGTVRPRRGDQTPAKFDEFTVIKPTRGRPTKKRVAEVQPTQQQQQEQVEHDDLSAALAIPGLPTLPDFGGAIREFMLGEGPKLSMEEYKDLTLPLHRYLVDRLFTEWFGKLRFATKTNYLNAIHRVTGAHQPLVTTALVLPYDGIAASIDLIIQAAVDSGRVTHPSGTLSAFQSALTRLVAIQLGVPAEQRPIADVTKKFKNDTLLAIENKCTNGGRAWKLLVEKWRGYAHPNKRVAAVQKNAQAKLITVAEIKQVQAVALMSPLRELDAILLSVAGLSFLMSRGNRSEILPHLKFFGMKLTTHQKHDGTTRRPARVFTRCPAQARYVSDEVDVCSARRMAATARRNWEAAASVHSPKAADVANFARVLENYVAAREDEEDAAVQAEIAAAAARLELQG